MDMDTIVNDWKQNAESRYKRNFNFLRSLKSKDEEPVDQAARKLHAEVFSIIDCTRCGNCCRTSNPVFTEQEIERIAQRLGMTGAELIEKHFVACEDEDGMQPKTQPCPLLGADTRCTVYEDRPASCAGFPYTDEEGFACRTYMHAANALGCPAVFYIIERMRAGGV
jgi:uncharacterized protein